MQCQVQGDQTGTRAGTGQVSDRAGGRGRVSTAFPPPRPRGALAGGRGRLGARWGSARGDPPKGSAPTNAPTRKAPGPRPDTVTRATTREHKVHNPLPSRGAGPRAGEGRPRPECAPCGRGRPSRAESGAAYPVGGLAAEARGASMEPAGGGRGRRSGPASQALAAAAAALIHFFRADPSSSLAGRRRTAAGPERRKGLERTRAGGSAGRAGRGWRGAGAPGVRCAAPPGAPPPPPPRASRAADPARGARPGHGPGGTGARGAIPGPPQRRRAATRFPRTSGPRERAAPRRGGAAEGEAPGSGGARRGRGGRTGGRTKVGDRRVSERCQARCPGTQKNLHPGNGALVRWVSKWVPDLQHLGAG